MLVQEMVDKEVFSRLDLSWTKVCCREVSEKDLVAVIPLGRLDDFKRGEQNNP